MNFEYRQMTNDRPPTTYDLVPREEIFNRIARLQQELAALGLDGAMIVEAISVFYYTGTMQNGVLFAPSDGPPIFFVRRSLERARRESPLEEIVQINRLGDLPDRLKDYGHRTARIGIDETTMPVSFFKKLSSAFPQAQFQDIARLLSAIRSVKSDYEIGLVRESGRRQKALHDTIPGMIKEGMTEWELGAAIQAEMLRLGHTGITRVAGFNAELAAGVVSFGDSGNFPTGFIGPDGSVGLSPAFPLLGGTRRLEKGDIIFVDTGFAYGGYYTDKTRIFAAGRPSGKALDAHKVCLDIQEAIRQRLKPGAVASDIFDDVYRSEVAQRHFEENFMGFGSNRVSFLGHGVGLVIDEFPAIAATIDFPLREKTVMAVEPKKGLKGIGLVGIENTFLVTEQGGERLTPGTDEIVIVR